tara:strand:- start:1843 stop:2922 length:1080 start_codon:yes stop_codon:yes gene_type:complete
MNTDALSSRYAKIPARLQKYAEQIWSHLQKSNKVVSAHFLANFEKDHDASLRYNTDIFKGLVVAVDPTYELTDADIMWMHPHAYQCRAIFEGGSFDKVTLPEMEASAGIYKVSSIDDIGTQCEETYTVVDTRMPYTRNGNTPQEAYDNTMKQETLENCASIAENMGSENIVDHAFTNLFLKNTSHYVFYNHAFHNKGIVHISPLMGYRAISSPGMIPADCLNEQYYVNVENLSDEKKVELFKKCMWEGDSPINTYALRTPFDTMSRVGTHYRLDQANFAQTPIHDKMNTRALYDLSANLNCLGLSRFGDHVETQHIRLPAKEDTVVRLMRLGDVQIINPEFTDTQGNLVIPRHIVEQLF